MLPEHICSSDRCKQLHSSKYKLRLFGNSLSPFLFSSGTRMFSSLVETVGAGYFYSDSLCNNFYSKRSTVITLKRKKKKKPKISVSKSWVKTGPHFSLFLKRVEEKTFTIFLQTFWLSKKLMLTHASRNILIKRDRGLNF